MSLYDELGVPEDADTEQITRAYRDKVLKAHPDAGGDPEEFRALTVAYDILSDDRKRAHYDGTGETESCPDLTFELLAVLLRETLSDVVSAGRDPEKVNLVSVMREKLDGKERNLLNSRREATRKKDQLQRVAERFEGEDEYNVVSSTLAAMRRDLQSNISQLNDQLEMVDRAKEIITKYRYRNDEEGSTIKVATWPSRYGSAGAHWASWTGDTT